VTRTPLAGVCRQAQPGWRSAGGIRASGGHGCPKRASGDGVRVTRSRTISA